MSEHPFRGDEKLYRRLIERWVTPEGTVDPGAIEFPRTSVDRGEFSNAEQTLKRGNANEIAVAQTTFSTLPRHFTPDGNGDHRNPPKAYELCVSHCPEVGNHAHTHLETRPIGEQEPKKPGGAMKEKIRKEVAASMQIVLRRSGG